MTALRVLVPTDGSDPACRATQHVLDLAARGLSLEVHLLNVRPAVRGIAASLVSTNDLEGYHREEGMKALAEPLRLLEAAGLKPHAHVGVGEPGETILAFARRLSCEQAIRPAALAPKIQPKLSGATPKTPMNTNGDAEM